MDMDFITGDDESQQPPTSMERDLQARGKFPLTTRNIVSEENLSPRKYHPSHLGPALPFFEPHFTRLKSAVTTEEGMMVDGKRALPEPEDFELEERKGYAHSVLSDYDTLMIHAVASGESIPGKRFEMEALLCGLDHREIIILAEKRRKEKEKEKLRQKQLALAAVEGRARRLSEETSGQRD